jgi:hypothetical protein
VTATHWCAPDIWGDILSAAWRPDVVEPVAIHIRPELHAQLLQHREVSALPGRAGGLLERSARVPVVIDEEIPSFPGFEIHRARPTGSTIRPQPRNVFHTDLARRGHWHAAGRDVVLPEAS